MTAQELYITSVRKLFSTFMKTIGVDDSRFEEAHALLVTVLRSLVSVTDFVEPASCIQELAKKHSFSENACTSVTQFVSSFSLSQMDVFLSEYLLALKSANCSTSTIKNYRSDINQFIEFSKSAELTKTLTKQKVLEFIRSQRSSNLAGATIKRKLVSLAQFSLWLETLGVVTAGTYSWLENLSHDEQPHDLRGDRVISGLRKRFSLSALLSPQGDLTHKQKANKSQEYTQIIKENARLLQQSLQKKGDSFITRYANVAMILLFLISFSYFGYQQFIVTPDKPLAFPSTLTRPNRTLSFQGRLTDTAQNPITAATNFRFRLYDSGPGTGSGTQLWDSGTCSITPDQDGIFSSGLGSDCGTEIASSVFSENANVWLQVEVGAETLSPRQSIKSVAYALNSETLQGFPPADPATANTVVVMNNSGEVVLGGATPKLKASSTSLTLEGTTLNLQTTSGSNGNIVLDPDGLGQIIARDYIGAPGATLSATYAGGTALTLKAGPSATADIVKWQSSAGSTLGVISATGNIGIGTTSTRATLDAAGDASVSGSFVLRTGTSSIDVLDGQRLDINTSPGGDAGLASKVSILNNGNLGLGTTNPNTKLVLYGTSGTVQETVTNTTHTLEQGVTSSDGYLGLSSNSPLRFYTNNTNRMQISAAGGLSFGSTYYSTNPGANNAIFEGSLGIGTTGPTQSLHVQNNMRLVGGLYDSTNSVGTNGYVLKSTGSATQWVDGNTLYDIGWWDNTQNALHPRAEYAGVADLLLGSNATSAAKFAFINVNSGTPTASISGTLAIASPTGSNPATTFTAYNGGTFNFRTSVGGDAVTNSRLYINNNGNIGIGTTIPTHTLEVKATGSVTALGIHAPSETPYAAQIYNDTYSTTNPIFSYFPRNSGVFEMGTDQATNLRFYTSGYSNVRMAINAAGGVGIGSGTYLTTTPPTQGLLVEGNVGIGTTVSRAKLDVIGDASASGSLVLRGTNPSTIDILNGNRLDIQTSPGGDAGLVSKLTLLSNGNFGIGTINPTETLQVAGDILQNNARTRTMTRTMPTVVNDVVDIGSFSFTNGGASLWVSITVPSGSFSVAKEYNIPIAYNETTNTWVIAQPISDTGVYSSNDFDLDVNVNNGTTSLRIRRTAGSTAGTAYVVIRQEGIHTDSFTASTSTSSVAAPTAYYSATAIRQVGGSVGIGTTAPAYALHVDLGATSQYPLNLVSSGKFVRIGAQNATYAHVDTDATSGFYFYDSVTTGAGNNVLNTSSGTSTLVSAGGNLGIGTTAATGFKVQVQGGVGPQASATYDLGSNALRWNNIYGTTIYQGNNQVCDTSGNCSAIGNFWQYVNGAISPSSPYTNNSDVLIGGNATTSAKFAFMNVMSGTPTASISGNLAIASPTGSNPTTTYTAFNGGSINFRTSVGGDAVTNSRLYISNNGNIGINSTSPGARLNVYDSLATGTNLVLSNIQSAPVNGGGSTISRVTAGTNTSDFEQNNSSTSPFRYGTYIDTNIVNNYTAAGGLFGSINFVTNNAVGMTLTGGNAAGNLGIGVTAANVRAKLDVAGDASASGSLVLRSTTFSTIDMLNGGRLDFQTSPGGDNGLAAKVSLLSNGNLGVGTTAPLAKLQVFDVSSGNFRFANGAFAEYYQAEANPRFQIGRDGAGSGQAAISFGPGGASTLAADGAAVGYAAADTLGLYTSNNTALTERMRIDGAGNISIGTTTTSNGRLQVAGDTYVATTGFTFTNPTAGADLYVQSNIEADGSIYGASVYQYQSGTAYQVCDSSGNCSNAGLWQNNQNALHPRNEFGQVADLLIGGTATLSAEFRVTGQGNGTTNLPGYVYAKRYLDIDDTNYYVEPGNTGTAGVFAGSVGIGATPSQQLTITGSFLANNAASRIAAGSAGYLSRVGIYSSPTFTDSSTTVYGVNSQATVNNTNSSYHAYYESLAVGSGATITDVYGIRITDPTGAGAITNNYGIYIDSLAKGSSLDYAIYSAGTNTPSYFAGNIGFGTSTINNKIELADHTAVTGGIGFGSDVDLYRSGTDTLSIATGDNFAIGGTTVLTSGRILQTANGNAGSPAQTFSSDATTGSFLPSSGNFAISTGGTEQVRVSNLGNVGIGTTNPSTFKLQVNGSIGPQTNNSYDLGSNALRWATVYATSFKQAGNDVCDSSGNCTTSGLWARTDNVYHPRNEWGEVVDVTVGGTSTASAGFRVTGKGNGTTNLSGYTYARRYLDVEDANYYVEPGNTTTAGVLAGNVGIGTTTTSNARTTIESTGTQLRLNYSGAVYANVSTDTNGYLTLNSTGNRVSLDGSGTYYLSENAAASNLHSLILNRSAGTGYTTPDIYGASGGIVIGGLSGATGTVAINTSGTATPTLISSGGSIGVGTNSPGQTLDVQSTGTASIRSFGPTNPYLRAQDSTNNVITKLQALDTFGYAGTESNHSFGIISNNTQRIYVDAAGNVGINDGSASSFKLQVGGDVGPSATTTYNLGSNSLRWNNIYGTALYQGNYQVCDLSGNCSNAGLWQNNQNAFHPRNEFASVADVLIGGTSTASAKFAFTNIAAGSPTASISGNLALTVPTGSTPGSTLDILDDGTLNIRQSPGGNAGLTSRIFIASNGNIGIGNITTPAQSLDISGNLRVRGNLITDSGDATRLTLGSTTTLSNSTTTLSGTSTITASSLATFTTNATLGMTSTTALNLGNSAVITLGASATGGTLNGSSGSDGDLVIQGTSHTTRTSSYVNIQPSGGNVGIGTTTPSSVLEIAGTTLPAFEVAGTQLMRYKYGPQTYNVANAPMVLKYADSTGGGYGTASFMIYFKARDDSNIQLDEVWYFGTQAQYNSNGYAYTMQRISGTKKVRAYEVTNSGANLEIQWTLTDDDRAAAAGNFDDSVEVTVMEVLSGHGEGHRGTFSVVDWATKSMSGSEINNGGNAHATFGGTGTNWFMGSVGIGTTAPTQGLHVAGNARITGALYDASNSPGSNGYIFTSTGTGTSWINPETLLDSGWWDNTENVLHPRNEYGAVSDLAIGGTSTVAATFRVTGSGNGGSNLSGYVYAKRYIDIDSQNYYIEPGLTSTSGLFAGSVGIGTTTASQKLTVAGSSNTENYVGIGDTSERLKIGYGHATGVVDNVLPAQIIVDSTGHLILSSRTNSASGIQFYTNAGTDGVERMRIDTAGNVGIGTTIANAKLDVAGDASASGSLVLRNTTISTIDMLNGGRLDFQTSPGGDNGLAAKLTLLNNGNIGIGSIAPIAKLDVNGNTNITGNLDVSSGVDVSGADITGGTGVQIDFADEVTDKIYWYSTNYGTGIESSTLTNWSASTFRWRVGGTSASSGTAELELNGTALQPATNNGLNLGTASLKYGTGYFNTSVDSPLYTYAGNLDISATGANAVRFNTNGSLKWSVLSGGQLESNGASTIRTSTGNLTLATNAGNGHIILSPNGTGNVGVGSTTPTAKLDVAGDASASGSLVLRNTTVSTIDMLNGGRLDFQTSPGGDNGLAAKLTLLNNGNTGIGTTGPTNTLDVNGTLRVRTYGAGTTTAVCKDGSGVLTDCSGSFVTGSGVTNRVARWTGTGSIGTGVLWDDGTNVGVGDTTPSGLLTVGSSDNFVVDSNGRLRLNSATESFGSYVLSFDTGATSFNSAGSIYGIKGTVSNSNTGNVTAGYFYAQSTGSGTIPTAIGVDTGIKLNNAGGTISTAVGLNANSPAVTAGAITNAVGAYIWPQDVSGVGTGYGILQAGSADINTFAGNVGIGTTGASYKLDTQVAAGSANIFRAGQTGVSNGLTITTNGTSLDYNVLSGNTTFDASAVANVGSIYLRNSTNYSASRNNYLINLLGSMAGRLINRNAEMLDGTTGYTVYDNSAGGKTTLSAVASTTAPNTSGQALRISYNGTGTPNSNPNPGYGGFYASIPVCGGTNNGVNTYCYREGNRYVVRIWANIPSGRSLYYANNAYGTGGNYQWLTSQAGTGNWQEYIIVQTIGTGGTLSTIGFWYVDSGSNAAFTWDVASVHVTGVDESPSVETASNLNVGYYQGKNLAYGELTTSQGAFLALSGGNVGIGTTTANNGLHIRKDETAGSPWTGQLYIEPVSNDAHAAISLKTTMTGTDRVWSIIAGNGTPSTNLRIYDSTAGADRINIDSNGYVGINTTNPLTTFNVVGAAKSASDTNSVTTSNASIYGTGNRTAGNGAALAFASAANTDGTNIWDQARILGAADNSSNGDASGRMYLQTRYYTGAAWDWRNNLVLLSSGNVGVGTTSTSGRLQVDSGSSSEVALVLKQSVSANYPDIFCQNNVGSSTLCEFTSGMFNNGGTLYNAGSLIQRGTISNDTAAHLTIAGGTSGRTYFSGNVGIGTTVPNTNLNVYGANTTFQIASTTTAQRGMYYSESNNNLYIGGSSTQDGNINVLNLSAVTAVTLNSAGDSYFNGGNLGIGTTSTVGKLDIRGATRSGTHTNTQTMYVTGTMQSGQTGGGTGNIEFRHDNATQGIGFGYNTIYQAGTNTNQDLNFLSKGTSPITLNAYAYSSGNVGVGTTGPTAKLHVYGSSTTFQVSNTTTTQVGMWYGEGGNDLYIGGGSTQDGDINIKDLSGNIDVKLSANSATVSYFNSGANVGIGATSASQKLDVAGQIQFDIDTANDTTIGVCKNTADGTSTATEFRECNGTPSDIAEFYRAEAGLRPGDVVSLTEISGVPTLVSSSSIQGASVFGVVSTFPVGQFGKPLGHELYSSTENPVAIGLAGRVPVRVNLSNGPISAGDALTESSTPGVAAKAIRPGKIIGYAIESFNENSPIVSTGTREQEALRANNIAKFNAEPIDPTDQGEGKILLYVHAGYYYPNMIFGSEGELVFNGTGQSNYTITAQQNGTVLSNIIAAAQVMSAKMKTSFLQTRELFVSERASVANLDATTLTTQVATVSGSLHAEIATVDQLSTQDLSVAGTLTATGQSQLGVLLAESASISGSLTAQTASISGELIAQNLTISGSTRLAQIEAQQAQLMAVQATTAELFDATVSGTLYAQNIADLDAKIASAIQQPNFIDLLTGNEPTPPPAANPISVYEPVSSAGYTPVNPTFFAEHEGVSLVTGDVLIDSAAVFVRKYLEVNGVAYVTKALGIGETLQIGAGTIITDGVIAYTGTSPATTVLQIQPSGTGKVEILAGLITLQNGTATIAGDLTIAGKTKTNTLLTNLIQPADFGNPFQVQVAGISTQSGELKKSRFEIINELGTPVATISAEGKANFAGGIGVGSEEIAVPSVASGSSVTVSAQKTSGKAKVPAGTSEITIESESITDTSLIYVTPVGSTQNQVLYVKSQTTENISTSEKEGKFVVGFDAAVSGDVSFNWWIVN